MKRRSPGRVDWNKTILITLSPDDLAKVRDAKSATLRVTVGPRDERGWSIMTASLLEAGNGDSD